ncbi:MAG TPA: hypothetical protein VGE52_01800 [Pirellulales bacterium]
MSRFRDAMKADDVKLFRNLEEFGETIVYHRRTPGAEWPRVLTAIVDQNNRFSTRDVRDSVAEELWVWIGKHPAAVGGGVSDPALGDYIEYDGRQWALTLIEGGDPDNWELIFVHNQPVGIGKRTERR